MPISDGKYVAPTWVNDSSPSIDADELQAMCDTIESNQNARAVSILADDDLTNSFSVHKLLTSNESATVNGIAYGNNTLCAVAGSYGVLYNKNGFDWYTTTNSAITGTMNDITFGNGMFVAVGDSNIISFTDPAGTWSTRTLPTNSGAIYAVVYFSGRWVIGTSNGIYSSTDLASWSQLVAYKCTGLDICNNSFIVAATTNGGYSSTDGVTFTAISGSSTNLKKVSASETSNAYVFVGGSDDETFATYYNGSGWSIYEPSSDSAQVTDCLFDAANDSIYLVEKWTDDETYARIIKGPFASDGGTYCDTYGGAGLITCAKMVNNEIYFGTSYGGIITNVKSGSLVDASGDVLAPRFYGGNLLADYIVQNNNMSWTDNDGSSTFWLQSKYLSGKIEYVAKLKVAKSTLSSRLSYGLFGLTMPQSLIPDAAGVWAVSGSVSIGTELASLPNYKIPLVSARFRTPTSGSRTYVSPQIIVQTIDGTVLSNAFDTDPEFTIRATFIPNSIINPSA